MSGHSRYYQAACPSCSHATLCGLEEMVRWLMAEGKLKLTADPEPDLIAELFLAAAPGMMCHECGSLGLLVTPAEEDFGGWPDAVACEACGKTIPEERLDALPGVTLCAACQDREERGQPAAEAVEYCPKCGCPMVMRPRRAGGVTRYVMACTASPPCRL